MVCLVSVTTLSNGNNYISQRSIGCKIKEVFTPGITEFIMRKTPNNYTRIFCCLINLTPWEEMHFLQQLFYFLLCGSHHPKHFGVSLAHLISSHGVPFTFALTLSMHPDHWNSLGKLRLSLENNPIRSCWRSKAQVLTTGSDLLHRNDHFS